MKTTPKKTPASTKAATEATQKSVTPAPQQTAKPTKVDKPASKPKSAKAPKQKSKSAAPAFPIVAVIDEQIRTSIPPDLVARVNNAPSRKTIGGLPSQVQRWLGYGLMDWKRI